MEATLRIDMVYFWSDLPLIYTVWSYLGIKDCTFVYHDKSAVFSCFRTKSTQNGKNKQNGASERSTRLQRGLFFIYAGDNSPI